MTLSVVGDQIYWDGVPIERLTHPNLLAAFKQLAKLHRTPTLVQSTVTFSQRFGDELFETRHVTVHSEQRGRFKSKRYFINDQPLKRSLWNRRIAIASSGNEMTSR